MAKIDFISLANYNEFNETIKKEKAVLIYFSHEKCNVCKVLKPKVRQMVSEKFLDIKLCYADTELAPSIAGQNSVFTVPTILVFFETKEYIRKSRNIGIAELEELLTRPYQMVFEK